MPRTLKASGTQSSKSSIAGARLRQRADFLRVAAAGLRRVTPTFILQAAPGEPGGAAGRIGFTASRKVGNAVARNRAKRRLRALAHNVMSEADPALDYVLVARAAILGHTFAAMEADLRTALKRLGTKR